MQAPSAASDEKTGRACALRNVQHAIDWIMNNPAPAGGEHTEAPLQAAGFSATPAPAPAPAPAVSQVSCPVWRPGIWLARACGARATAA